MSILGLFEFINDEDILEVIAKLKTTLKKNGKILITTPNFNSSISTLSKLSSFIGGIDYREQHINKFNEKKARALLEGTDFTNVKIDCKEFLLPIIFLISGSTNVSAIGILKNINPV